MNSYSFLVSVIIPVYNAADFIVEAVNSVVSFDEVGEVLLIEDGSDDESFKKCKSLEMHFNKVRVLTHSGNINRGVSASRNLGIINSIFPFVAFLDADDYFLSNRFDSFRNFLSKGFEFDGVYEPIQYFNGSDKIYGINKVIDPKKLTTYLITGTFGHFHTNGLIVKKQLLLKSGLFVESLTLHQDSDLWIKLSFYGKLIPGIQIYDPVAKVRIHSGNRIWKGTSNASRYKQLKTTWSWAKNQKLGVVNKLLLFRKLLIYKLNVIISK